MRRIESGLVVAFVLLCAAPAVAGLISIDPADNPAGADAIVICQAAMSGSDVVVSSSDVRIASSHVAWPYGDEAGTKSPFRGFPTEAGRSLVELTQLTAGTADTTRDTDHVTARRPGRIRTYSLDNAVDWSALLFPLVREDARTGPETFISLLGSPGRG